MLCPNCMSPHVRPVETDAEQSVPEEPMLECTECEYVAPASEFLPENYR